MSVYCATNSCRSDCYRTGFLSDASDGSFSRQLSIPHHLHQGVHARLRRAMEVPRARGRIIVGTHRLCVRGSAEPLPPAASYGIGIRTVPRFTRFSSKARALAQQSLTGFEMPSRPLIQSFLVIIGVPPFRLSAGA